MVFYQRLLPPKGKQNLSADREADPTVLVVDGNSRSQRSKVRYRWAAADSSRTRIGLNTSDHLFELSPVRIET